MKIKHTPEPWEIGYYPNSQETEFDGLVIWSPEHSKLENGKRKTNYRLCQCYEGNRKPD